MTMKSNFEKSNFEEINLEELKAITFNAKKQQQEEETRKRREELFQKQMEMEKMRNEALSIIQTIPYKVKQAASQGLNYADIVELKWEDFMRTNTYRDRYHSECLNLKARLIWEFLEEKRLQPHFYTAHDGFGEKSWDYIRANW